MSITFPSVKNTLVNTATWVVHGSLAVGRAVTNLAGSAFHLATPHLRSLISKIKEIDVKAIAHAVKSFFQTDLGVASLAFTICGYCAIRSHQTERKLAFLGWVVAAVALGVFGSVLLINPSLIHPTAIKV